MADYFDYEGSNFDDYQDGVLDSYKLDDEYYSVPMQIISHYLFWDKDMFEAAGLDPEISSETMEEVAEIANNSQIRAIINMVWRWTLVEPTFCISI